jgi:hypothetical protein
MKRNADPNRDEAVRRSGAASDLPAPAQRQAYAAPSLIVYGRVSDLTRTVGRRGRKDHKRGRRRTGY